MKPLFSPTSLKCVALRLLDCMISPTLRFRHTLQASESLEKKVDSATIVELQNRRLEPPRCGVRPDVSPRAQLAPNADSAKHLVRPLGPSDVNAHELQSPIDGARPLLHTSLEHRVPANGTALKGRRLARQATFAIGRVRARFRGLLRAARSWAPFPAGLGGFFEGLQQHIVPSESPPRAPCR